MDLLQNIIAKKKKDLTVSTDLGSRGWARRGDRIDEECRKREASVAEREQSKKRLRMTEEKGELEVVVKEKRSDIEVLSVATKTSPTVPVDEVISRLRRLGEVVTFFGETDVQREARLLKFELEIEESKAERMGQKNELQEALEDGEGDGEAKAQKDNRRRVEEEAKEKQSFLPSDTSKEALVYRWIKNTRNDWGKRLSERPENVQKSAVGKRDSANFYRLERDLQPLLRQLRRRSLATDMLSEMANIVSSCSRREYVSANDAYLRIAIGNAPWPMGVTMVGIHERSGREKIFVNNVAHVLNDESTRKYLQGVKRLITFCQREYPTDPSKTVG